jgi:hypothetical protein
MSLEDRPGPADPKSAFYSGQDFLGVQEGAEPAGDLYHRYCAFLSGSGSKWRGLISAEYHFRHEEIRRRLHRYMQGELQGLRYSVWHEGVCLGRWVWAEGTWRAKP